MLTLEFETYEVNENGKEVFEEYDWWKELVRKVAEKADSFELRCWEDEEEAISFGRQFGEEKESTTKELVFTGKLSQEILDKMTEDCVSKTGNLKYFTVNFYHKGELIFDSSHYGSEIYWMNTGFAEMGFLMMLIKNHPIIKGFENR